MTPIARFALPVAFLLAMLGMALMVRSTPEPQVAAPIVPRVTLDSLLAVEASGAVSFEPAFDAPTAGVESAEAHAEMVAAVVPHGANSLPMEAATVSAMPHVLEVEVSGLNLASLARCGIPCWGERLTRDQVHALALDVSGDAAWSAWASVCFTKDGGESGGYVAAVGGPNRNGTYDAGIGQSNTDTLAWLGYAVERVLVDVRYAMEALHHTWRVQGYGAWFGCAAPGGGE